MRFERLGIGIACVVFGASCAHRPSGPPPWANLRPEALFRAACEPGRSVVAASGSVWITVDSRELDGKFPAFVKTRFPGKLDMEITNLFGGTEARVKIRGTTFEILRQGKVQAGGTHWAGIPLRWATDLMLGRVPCPPVASVTRKGVTRNADQNDEYFFEVLAGEDSFAFQFERTGERWWPVRLIWRNKEALPIDFNFKKPEERTGSPLYWEARSDRGAVKVRWKDRQVVANSTGTGGGDGK